MPSIPLVRSFGSAESRWFVTGVAQIGGSEGFLDGHFPADSGLPRIVPGVLQLGLMAKTSVTLLGGETLPLTDASEVRWHKPLTSNEPQVLFAEVLYRGDGFCASELMVMEDDNPYCEAMLRFSEPESPPTFELSTAGEIIDITELIPHGPQFRFLTAATNLDPDCIVAYYDAEEGGLDQFLTLEAMAQAGLALINYGEPSRKSQTPLLSRALNIKWYGEVLAGERLWLTNGKIRQRGSVYKAPMYAVVDGEVRAEGTFVISFVDGDLT